MEHHVSDSAYHTSNLSRSDRRSIANLDAVGRSINQDESVPKHFDKNPSRDAVDLGC